MDKKQVILNFLKTQVHIVISTVNLDNNPESALVGFCEMPDLTLIFGTYTIMRKYKNILKNPHVSLVFGSNEGITIQYEGVATVLQGEELETYKQAYFAKTPSSKKYETYPHQVYLKITPTWIRYTNYNKEPEEIFELSF